MSTVLDDTALGLGLPPAGTSEWAADSDYGLISQRLDAYLLETLHRGWWFNCTDEELVPDGTGQVPMGSDVLRVYPLRHQAYSPPVKLQGAFQVDGPSRLLVHTSSTEELTKPFTAEIVRFVDLTLCPPELQRYLVARTVNAMANFYGIPKDPDEEVRTWGDLLRADGDNRVTPNTIDSNPINYRLSRRR